MSVCVCVCVFIHTYIYILFSLFMVYLYLAPFLHSIFPLPYISFFLYDYNSFPLLFTILFAFLIYLAIYGCFELVLSSYSFLSNLIFLSLFSSLFGLYFCTSLTQYFSVLLQLPLLTLALIHNSYLHAHMLFHFGGSFSSDHAV